MCNTISLFKNLRNVNSSMNEVVIPYSSMLKITKVADIYLDNNLILKDVLYVPKMHST